MKVARQEQGFHKDSIHVPIRGVVWEVSIAHLIHSKLARATEP